MSSGSLVTEVPLAYCPQREAVAVLWQHCRRVLLECPVQPSAGGSTFCYCASRDHAIQNVQPAGVKLIHAAPSVLGHDHQGVQLKLINMSLLLPWVGCHCLPSPPQGRIWNLLGGIINPQGHVKPDASSSHWGWQEKILAEVSQLLPSNHLLFPTSQELRHWPWNFFTLESLGTLGQLVLIPALPGLLVGHGPHFLFLHLRLQASCVGQT